MAPLGDMLTTRRIKTGWQFTVEPYQSRQFGFILDKDHQFGNSAIWTRTRTRSEGPELLLTLIRHIPDTGITSTDLTPGRNALTLHRDNRRRPNTGTISFDLPLEQQAPT